MAASETSDFPILLCGLPGSGKTSFLAALWHLVSSQEATIGLRFKSLPDSSEYLVELETKWLTLVPIGHTPAGRVYPVTMNLSSEGMTFALRCPDVSGELWMHLWEGRQAPVYLKEQCDSARGILLFVHSDQFESGLRLTQLFQLNAALGDSSGETDAKALPWDPAKCPTQVILVDLLQFLSRPPLGSKKLKVAIILSAWDLAAAEGKTPVNYLNNRMPFLSQFLVSNQGSALDWRVFGVSALGGDPVKDKARLLGVRPYERIVVHDGSGTSCDLTKPISWLAANDPQV